LNELANQDNFTNDNYVFLYSKHVSNPPAAQDVTFLSSPLVIRLAVMHFSLNFACVFTQPRGLQQAINVNGHVLEVCLSLGRKVICRNPSDLAVQSPDGSGFGIK
jgi:hypothetical protein